MLKQHPFLLCRVLLSKQFQPRVGMLAAKPGSSLQQALLRGTHIANARTSRPTTSSTQVVPPVQPADTAEAGVPSRRGVPSKHKSKSAAQLRVSDQRLLTAIDLLKPLLAEASGDLDAGRGIHTPGGSQRPTGDVVHAQRTTGGSGHIV